MAGDCSLAQLEAKSRPSRHGKAGPAVCWTGPLPSPPFPPHPLPPQPPPPLSAEPVLEGRKPPPDSPAHCVQPGAASKGLLAYQS